TNNGELVVPVVAQVLAPLRPRLRQVLCSGALGVRKPQPQAFQVALERLGWSADGTLFVDDLFANVQGARRAGLHADTARDARAVSGRWWGPAELSGRWTPPAHGAAASDRRPRRRG